MEFTNEMIKELKTALKDKNLAPYHKRIQAVYLRSIQTSYKSIMEMLDVSHDTVWRLTKKYQEHGLTGLTSDARGGRRHSYMTVEEEQAFLSEQLTSAVNGEFVTIESLYRAYQDKLGRTTTKDGFYQLLKRNGWRKVTPRPEHPKKADAETIVASKNKIKTLHPRFPISELRKKSAPSRLFCIKMRQGLVGLVNWGLVGVLKTTARISQAITFANFVTAMVR